MPDLQHNIETVQRGHEKPFLLHSNAHQNASEIRSGLTGSLLVLRPTLSTSRFSARGRSRRMFELSHDARADIFSRGIIYGDLYALNSVVPESMHTGLC
jgi:hypothetical protein